MMFPINSKCFLYHIYLCFLLFIPVAYATDGAEIDFSIGVKEYKKGHYDAALEDFLNAKQKGYQSAQLFHNLGVVYLKLGQLERAKGSFSQSLNYPSIAPLAHYNLALIAIKRGDDEAANSHFEDVIALSQDPNLTALAKQRLLKQTVVVPVSAIKSWQVFARVGSGYDDNVRFTPEDVGGVGKDGYTELLLYGTAMLAKNKPVSIALDAYVYDVNYDDISTNDYIQSSFLLKFPMYYMNWKIQPGLIAQWSKYGGEGYQRIQGGELRSKYIHSLSTSYLIKYTYENIDSLNVPYDFLEGSRQRLKLEAQFLHKGYKTNIYHELEVNSRSDRKNESYSPMRNTLSGQISYALNNSLSLNGNVKYRISDYPKIAAYDRHDKQFQFSWGGLFRLNKYTSLRGVHTWTNNDSSDPQRDYNRHRVILSVQLSY